MQSGTLVRVKCELYDNMGDLIKRFRNPVVGLFVKTCCPGKNYLSDPGATMTYVITSYGHGWTFNDWVEEA